MRMSKMIIEVDFLPGTAIDGAIKEAKEKCIQWDVACVWFDFNGIRITVFPHDDIDDVYHEYQRKCSRPSKE